MSGKPLKVLFVLNSPGGGASQGIYEFLKTISRKEVEAFIVVPENPGTEKIALLSTLCRAWRVLPLSWWNLKPNLPWDSRLVLALKSNVKSIFRIIPLIRMIHFINKWRIDIVYTGTSLNIEGAIAAKITGRPHIWHIKETFGPKGRVQFPLNEKRLSRLFLSWSSKVIVMTHYIRSFFHKEVRDNKKIQVVYDGIDVGEFNGMAPGKVLRDKLGLCEDHILVAMVASLSSTWKKHHLFVEMARHLHEKGPKKLKYVMFGPLPKKHKNKTYNRPWEYYQNLMQTLQNHSVGKDFLWAGFHHDIPQLMDAIDILVHPCDIEPFGRIAIEAQAAGTVVVGPNTGGISESVVDEHSGILVDPDSAKALAKAVSKLANDASLRLKMGQNGKEHVRKTFPQAKHNLLILDIFKAVTEEMH